ncbi:hypothetical protein [Pseudoalteromonas agarivorans]|uniref:hypothetical protein n=1 Tax=Pseudoalteromonas agarivorans TaxID=176102 RepID=UPI00249ADCDB|nr:hypothetical protein [Pseudoalteromonas agarivorans]MDI3246901.1 hypothetical protein [Pseudoalteromonas agarivorans]
MTFQISKVLMPKACISCQAFCPKGYAKDQYSPFITKFDKPKPNADVFAVTNRPQPKSRKYLIR